MSDALTALPIHPGDEAWYLDGTDIRVFTAIAVDRDTCVFSTSLHGGDYDYFDATDPRSRFYRYSKGTWTCSEVKTRIVSMLLYREPGWTEDGLAVLSEDGKLWMLGEHGYQTKIDQSDADILSALRLLYGKLYACGHAGRIYRRDDDGWHHDDKGLLRMEPPVPRPRPADRGNGRFSVRDLTLTPDGRDFYACGAAYIARPALFWRPHGQDWSWLDFYRDNPAWDEIRLGRLYSATPDTVWITTDKGFLFKGNGRDGFAIATPTARDDDGQAISFSSIVRYRDHLYVGGAAACRLHPDGTLERLVGPPQASMESPDILSTDVWGSLGVADGVLWAMSYGVLSRFDGTDWERIPMPTVYHDPH